MSPLDKQIYTAALFHGLSLSGISFPPPRPGLRFTTRKTTTSGSPFSRTMHVIPNDTLDDAIKNSTDFDVRPQIAIYGKTLARRVVNPNL